MEADRDLTLDNVNDMSLVREAIQAEIIRLPSSKTAQFWDYSQKLSSEMQEVFPNPVVIPHQDLSVLSYALDVLSRDKRFSYTRIPPYAVILASLGRRIVDMFSEGELGKGQDLFFDNGIA